MGRIGKSRALIGCVGGGGGRLEGCGMGDGTSDEVDPGRRRRLGGDCGGEDDVCCW